MDIDKLSTPEKIISASAIVLLIASFMPWFSVEAAGIKFGDVNGWDLDFLVGPLPILLGLVMLAHVLLSTFAEDVSLGNLPWPKVHMVAGIVAAALLLLKLIIGEDGFGEIDVNRSYGLFLATLAGIGLAAGGFLYHQERDGTATAS